MECGGCWVGAIKEEEVVAWCGHGGWRTWRGRDEEGGVRGYSWFAGERKEVPTIGLQVYREEGMGAWGLAVLGLGECGCCREIKE